MDASHKEWFGSLLDKFKGAIASNDYVARTRVTRSNASR